jgi:colanic acid/amylovoran biosynthesis glycosyltransferase
MSRRQRDSADGRPTVLQAKFAAYLSWSQPFLHALLSHLDPHVRNVVLCNRTENLHLFPVRHVERLPNRYLVRPRLAVLAASYLRRAWAPDLIHAHFGWSGIRLLLLKQMLRVPLVVTFGGRDVGLQMRLPGFDELYRALLEASEAIICVSEDLRQRVLAAGADPARVHVVHRGTDLSAFSFVERQGRRPREGPLHALMVGRLVEKKGHRYALEAVAGLLREGRAVRLTVVGEGEAYGEICALHRRLALGGAVTFTGPTDHEGVSRYMAAADVLVHCSHTTESGDVEGIPNVVVEAQATGLPVVATRHGGIAEAVRDGETGILVPEREVAALRDALRGLADAPDRRLAMGRRAREFVTEHLSLEAQVAAHRRIYAEVVSRAAADPAFASRDWLPDEFLALMDRTVLARNIRNPSEFSIAELVEQLVWMRRFERRFEGAEEGEAGSMGPVFLPEASRLRHAGLRSTAEGEALATGAWDPDAGTSWLERAYGLKAYVPQALKFPVKGALGRALAWAIEQRYRRLEGRESVSLEEEDRRLLALFRAGGTLDDWEAGRAESRPERQGAGGGCDG